MDRNALAELFGQIAVHAGAIILPYHAQLDETRRKADGSPVTDADEASERYILDALREHLPEIPVIAEEEQSAGIGHSIGERFILVDPLDGTREFIKGRAEFAVNIGLIEDGKPIAGAIYAPLLSKLWMGGTSACVLKSADIFLKLGSATIELLPNRTLKFCRLAEGEVDLYPRFGPTMEWDVAAGHAIIGAAGGVVLDGDGRPFRYGKHRFESGSFVAMGQPDLAERLFR
ncbi:MAG: 3'(2'),5'-bisphosphate nucleotidase CysQ [Alphaproteobacteria bacterium]|nr:3'(2'),5'-bisphosphate nucleotidase CysQ [Alphaproteobacteria bacterium]